jgi:gliding motility-associated transport system permease protein
MSAIGLIFRRELSAFLRSPIGYVIAATVLCIDGLLYNAFALGSRPRLSAEVIHDFFYFSSGTTMVAAILLAMRLLAEERQLGTLVLLRTSPIREIEIVLGKYFSALAYLSLITIATLHLPLLVLVHGKVSWGHLFVGYSGLLLLGGAALAIGLLGSALAPNQLVAGVTGAGLLVMMLVLWLAARVADPPVRALLEQLALHARHFAPFMDGVVHLRDVFYYVGVAAFFLLCTSKALEARRWR